MTACGVCSRSFKTVSICVYNQRCLRTFTRTAPGVVSGSRISNDSFYFLLGSFLGLIFIIMNTYHIYLKKITNTFQKLNMHLVSFDIGQGTKGCLCFLFLSLPPPSSYLSFLCVTAKFSCRGPLCWDGFGVK